MPRDALARSRLFGLLAALFVAACGGGGDGPPAPTLLVVAPASGGVGGGTLLTLTGSGFERGVISVEVGGRAATEVAVLGPSSCTCRTPPGASTGTVAVVVTTPGGWAGLPNAFTYDLTLTLRRIEPDSGFEMGGARLTLTGSGFVDYGAGANTVTVGGAMASDAVAQDDATLVARLPPGAAGPAPVTVAVENARGSASLPDVFTYFSYPPVLLPANVRLDTDDAGAEESWAPQVACDGRSVYAVWSDDRNGEADVYFNRSTDGGATWLASDVRLDRDAPGAAASRFPQIACDGARVYVVWEELRNGSTDVYLNRSADGGSTWLAQDVRLDRDAPGAAASAEPKVVCDGAAVHVAWVDDRNGGWDVYSNHSDDGGLTWFGRDVRLDTDGPGAAQSGAVQVTCSGPNVYATWHDDRAGGSAVHYNRSLDGGSTWLADDVRLDENGPASLAVYPRIACDGPNAWVVWSDARSGAPDVYLARTTDAGTTWPGGNVRLDTDAPGAALSSAARICADGSHVYVVWKDDRGAATDLYLNRSEDGGATWLPVDVLVNAGLGVATSHFRFPAIGCDGTNVYVAWEDVRGGPREIYANVSVDGGSTWLAQDERLVDFDEGSATASYPQLACDGARLHVVWQDDRNGKSDVHLNATRP